MKRVIVVASLCALAACSKKDIQKQIPDHTPDQNAKPENCDFGITQFNLSKREPVESITERKPKNDSSIVIPLTYGVILLDFNGHLVSGTSWNAIGNINCTPANLSSAAINTILTRVKNDYAPFNITVTTNEATYTAAPNNRRIRVILTESWEWFGQAGGASFLNSFTWGNNTPCFVFTSLLNYNEKSIGEAASHETGHTFGLRHQSVYNGTVLVNQYNYGQGSGETGWAPIMGNSYNQNLSTWHNGPNNMGYASLQDDVAIITNVVGVRPDDYSNTTSNATSLSGTMNGYMNSKTDIDFFVVGLSSSKTISVHPFNAGNNNSGANEDLVVKVYNMGGQLLTTLDNPSSLSASGVLNPGQYYISVSSSPNANTTTYGMLGQYSIGLN
jgi:hypothetical protein